MEYQIMNDLYDTYASEAFKPESFGNYLKISSKGKIRSFFRALFRSIADFFRKMAMSIKALFTKNQKEKEEIKKEISMLAEDRYFRNLADRIADITRKAKLPAIKVTTAMRKLIGSGHGYVRNMRQADVYFAMIDTATNTVKDCNEDLARVEIHKNSYESKKLSDSNRYEKYTDKERNASSVKYATKDDALVEELHKRLTPMYRKVEYYHKEVFDDLKDAFDKCSHVFDEISQISDAIMRDSANNGDKSKEIPGKSKYAMDESDVTYHGVYRKLKEKLWEMVGEYSKFLEGLGILNNSGRTPSSINVRALQS